MISLAHANRLDPKTTRVKPKRVIGITGAPGAGKGTNTAFITHARGLTCPPIVVSALLDSPEAKALKDGGNMVGDREVVGLLLRQLLRAEYHDGAILDGFPRTNVQVECLKLLVGKMHGLRREFYGTPLSIHFRQPTVHIMVLFVDEKESVARQLKRGRETKAHNEEVLRSSVGELLEDRPTDHDEALAVGHAAEHRQRVLARVSDVQAFTAAAEAGSPLFVERVFPNFERD